jgi:uncharacterized protein YhaN
MWNKKPEWMQGRTLNFEFVDSLMINTAELLQELTDKVMQLPAVDEDGFSECPFVEDLYAQKDEVLSRVREKMVDLENSLKQLEPDVRESHKNLMKIRKAAKSVKRERPGHKLSFGEISQEFYYMHANYKKQVLVDLIAFSKKYSEIADSENIPRIKSRKTHSKQANGWGGKHVGEKALSENPAISRDEFADTHIDQLVDLGPLP